MVQIILFAHKSCKLLLLQNSQDWRKVWGKKLLTPNVKVRRRNIIGKEINRKNRKVVFFEEAVANSQHCLDCGISFHSGILLPTAGMSPEPKVNVQ